MPKYRDWMGQFIDANLDGGAKDSERIVTAPLTPRPTPTPVMENPTRRD